MRKPSRALRELGERDAVVGYMVENNIRPTLKNYLAMAYLGTPEHIGIEEWFEIPELIRGRADLRRYVKN